MKVLKSIVLLLFIFAENINAQTTQQLFVSIASRLPTCQAGFNDGTALALTNGVNAPYTYLWSNGKTTQEITGLSVGNYSVTVTDNTGEKAIAKSFIEGISYINVIENVKKASCLDAASGSIELIESNSGPLKYQWNDAKKSTSRKIANLAEGLYTVTITDNLGCTDTREINVGKGLEISETTSGFACESVGEIKIKEVKGGVAPYTYLWDNGNTGQAISNLKSGTYTVTVVDNNGCSDTKTILFYKDYLYVYGNVITHSACNKNDGKIETFTNNATSSPAFNYQWNTGQKTAAIDHLTPGAYTLTVTANHCLSVATFIVNGDISVQIDKNIPCGNNVGTITAQVLNGGTAPYAYLWNNGENGKKISVNNQLSAFMLTVTDAKGCVNVIPVTATLSSSIYSPIKIERINGCPHFSTDVQNGVSPYQYQWSNGSTNPTIELSNLSQGYYYVTVTDSKGCSGIYEHYLSSYHLSPSYNLHRSICGNGVEYYKKCNTYDYKFKWDNGTTANIVTGLKKGYHTVTITDETRNIVSIDTFNIESDSTCFKVGLNHQNELQTQVKVFPNPTQNDLYFIADAIENQLLSLKIYDLSGRLIYQDSNDKQQFYVNCCEFQNGIYCYQIKNQNGQSTSGRFYVLK